MAQELHEKYVPVLCFARGERFFPMAVEDFLSYCTLRQRGQPAPLAGRGEIGPALLTRTFERPIDVYLQSVPAALADVNVAARWGETVLEALAATTYRTTHWRREVVRVAYEWFTAKTQEATQLFWWNDLVLPLVAQGKRSRSDLPRLALPPEIRQAAVEGYERSQGHPPRYTYYHRTTRDKDYLCLQYWLFYAFNDWATGYGGMNDHEGDWEGLYLFFRLDGSGKPQEPPAYVTYVGHHSRLTKPWGHRDVTLEGTHPVAYVAAGSHATYPERKPYDLMRIYGLVDYATGDGVTIAPGDWKRRVNLDSEPWATPFLGTWGTRYWLSASWIERVVSSARAKLEEFGLPGVSGPRGPRYTDEATERPNWSRVVDWAGILHLQQQS